MKKKIVILAGILAALYIVLSLLDTSEYRVEKQLWRIQNQFAAIKQDPKAVPDAQYDHVIKKYRDLIKKFPDSRYVPQMYSSIGSLYLMNKQYDRARQVFGEVTTRFSDQPYIAARAFMDIANVYLIEEKFKEAVDIYKRVWDQYSDTEVGFMAPVYIVEVYRNTGRPDLAKSYLAKAVSYYKNIAENPEQNDMVRLSAYQMLANAYVGQQKWDAAVETAVKSLYDFADSEFMTPQRLRSITRTLNLVAIVELNDFDRAKTIYSDFIKDHPKHFLNPYLEKVMESLELLEKKKNQSASQQ